MTEEEALEIYKARSKKMLEDGIIFQGWKYKYYQNVLSEENFKKAIRLKNRKSRRRSRCFKKLAPIINEWDFLFNEMGIYCNIVFGTCTFNNNCMKWKEESRTKKVNKWIKEHFEIAIANIDYGEKTEREHHHFVGLTFEELEDTGKRSKKGFKLYNLKSYKNYSLGHEPDLEIIEIDNPKKVSNYMVKLNFHSNKKSTQNRRIRVLKKIKK